MRKDHVSIISRGNISNKTSLLQWKTYFSLESENENIHLILGCGVLESHQDKLGDIPIPITKTNDKKAEGEASSDMENLVNYTDEQMGVTQINSKAKICCTVLSVEKNTRKYPVVKLQKKCGQT